MGLQAVDNADGSGVLADTERWWRDRQKRIEATAAETRAEWFAANTDLPDLEFLTPECPICGLSTTYEDGFICEGCRVLWPKNGYGHQAQRLDDDEQEVQGPANAPTMTKER